MNKLSKYNSCLYEATVMHWRKEPVERRFSYNVFMFYLDEIDMITRKIHLISRNYFNFRDGDHLQLPKANPDKEKSIKEQIYIYLREKGINENIGRIMLLTNLATLGYNFNSVSFYFVYDKEDKPLCVVAEVGNTFGEMKPYLIGKDALRDGKFADVQQKYFYVSPFIMHDVFFEFDLQLPDDRLQIVIRDRKSLVEEEEFESKVSNNTFFQGRTENNIGRTQYDNGRINSIKGRLYDKNGRIDDPKGRIEKKNGRIGNVFFTASLTGHKRPLNSRTIFWYSLKFPFITLKVIFLIHFQAFKLWMKGVRYYKKNEFPELQKGAYRARLD